MCFKMGMFDEIKDELFCPFCGFRNNDFQTKDTGNLMTQWEIKEIIHCFDKWDTIKIYTECRNCKKWISINLEIRRLKELI